MGTKIEWAKNADGTPGKTWNPGRGCSMASAGCRRCWAMGQAHRFSGPGRPYEGLTELGPDGPRWTGAVRFVREKLAEPLRWRKPTTVFPGSMTDIFHPGYTNMQIAAFFGVMAATRRHRYLVLTKRAERMRDWFEWVASNAAPMELAVIHDAWGFFVGHYLPDRFDPDHQLDEQILEADWPLSNVLVGVSIENQPTANDRLIYLRDTPAAKRFVSYEPALSAWDPIRTYAGNMNINAFDFLDWIIVGSESGHRARPFNEDWVRTIRDQAVPAGVPLFYKQRLDERGKKVSTPELDGRTWTEMPR